MANVLIFSPREINTNMGGVERVSNALAKELSKVGHSVTFLSVDKTNNGEYEQHITQFFLEQGKAQEQILEIIDRHKINIIINQFVLLSYISRSAIPDDVKIVSVIHDSYYAMFSRLKLNWLRRWNWKRVIKKMLSSVYFQSDKVVLFVPEFKDEYRFFFPKATDDKFVIIPNFNSFDNVNVVPKEKNLLWVGRHAEWHKRTTDMLKIWSRLEDRYPDWSLDILGDGPDGKMVRILQAKLGLKRCFFRGVQDPKNYYEKAAFICMTSSFESWGMVLTEGMQHGCVPLAYDSYTALRYIIRDGEDGRLITPFDTDEYVRQLAILMENDVERERLSKAAIESVKLYDAEKVMLRWIELIESLL